MITEHIARICHNDPACSKWHIDRCILEVGVDAIFLATGVLLELGGAVIEDACWLHPVKGAQHINLAEFDAILEGVNLVLH